MKREARLKALITEMKTGQMSRNKCYDAYQTPDVTEARGRSRRLDRLLHMLDRAAEEQWQFQIEKAEEAGTWLLICQSEKLNGRWTARLFQFELDLLRSHPSSTLIWSGTEPQ